jgi:hypothetical protein
VHIEEFPKYTAMTKEDGRFVIAAVWQWEIWTTTDFVGDRRPAYTLMATAQGFEGGSRIWYIGDGRPQTITLKRSPD